MTRLYGGIHLSQIEQTVGTAHLVHLGVDARGDHFWLSCKTKILQVINTLLGLLVVHHHCAALDGVIDLGGMEREGGHVTCIEDALTIHLHTEGMGGIVDDLQAILVSDVLYLLYLTGFTINMHRHNGCGLRGDSSLNLGWVDVARLSFYIHKNRLDAVPPQGMSGCHKTVRRGDDFA